MHCVSAIPLEIFSGGKQPQESSTNPSPVICHEWDWREEMENVQLLNVQLLLFQAHEILRLLPEDPRIRSSCANASSVITSLFEAIWFY